MRRPLKRSERVYLNVFAVDYTDAEAVIQLAERCGPGMVVVKHRNRPNFNITHYARRDLWEKRGVLVVFVT